MSPAKSRTKAKGKTKGAPKGARKATRKPTRKATRKPAAKSTGRAAPAGALAKGGNVHAHCAATDPFGGPCQNVPRRPSTYCVIHSYLER